MKVQIDNALATYQEALTRMSIEKIVPRIWEHDHTVWSPDPEEILNRLGWLHLPTMMSSQIQRIEEFAHSVREGGFTHVVLLGMGGSSLAPDMLSHIFGTKDGRLRLQILDSTHPEAVRQVAQDHAPRKTLFIVATKSGTTSETLALFRYFYQSATERGDTESPGSRFIAITDPGTPLVAIASEHGFRDVFLNDPNLGGRYSALSLFGLIPAALLGLDLDSLLREAQSMAEECAPAIAASDNPAVQLGALLGSCALEGRDKMTLLLSKKIARIGDWIEQLIAESTGKKGKGIVPVLETLPENSKSYGRDRFFVAISLGDDPRQDGIVRQLIGQGLPVVQIALDTLSELAGQFYLWEFATAIACHVLGVHPFNQPNVESAKQSARDMADESRRTGTLPQLASEPLGHEEIQSFLEAVDRGDYVAIHAYLPQTRNLTEALQSLQASIRERLGVAVTLGYGPRFLHSTGQLHKGDRGNGHFIQLVSETMSSIPIPDSTGSADSSLSFGALITAQAFGDRMALENGDRSVLTLSVDGTYPQKIIEVATSLRARDQ